jgi:signal transduction histidine kinase
MAGFGFWAILRERNAVDEEAQQRAQAIIQSLPRDFDRVAANRLIQFDAANNSWLYYLRAGLSAWPDDKIQNQWLADPLELQSITNNLARLHSALPQWQSGPFPLASFTLDTNSDMTYGRPVPARPPAWLATLSAAQYAAWTALQAASCAAAPLATLTNLNQSFRQTKPPDAALACADFWLLRARLAGQPATNAVEQLLPFGRRHYGEISDSGVPLSTLALADALQSSRLHGPTQRLWESLQSEITSPNALTSRILDEAGNLVARDQRLANAIPALRILLANNLTQADFAQALKASGQLQTSIPASFWLPYQGQRWFILLNPSCTVTYSQNSRSTNPCVAVVGYPLPIVARGFADALGDANIALPDYFSVTLTLAGENVPLPLPWNKTIPGQPAGDLLAEGHFALRQLAGGPGVEIHFDAMPSHPEFTLQIRLTDRNLLYARQRQLQYIFGTLIGVSAAAALVGLIAAYRAFRRQQELSELKSNFVSSVSHELRAPIASVRLMAENLESGKIPGPAKQQEYYQFIVQECRRLSSLIENVLDFSRIEQGRKQYELEPTDLAALVRTTVKLMEPYALEKAVHMRLEPDGQPADTKMEATVDGRAIQQALVNLVDNAIKHSAAGQTVSVALVRREPPFAPSIQVSVTDQGPGIPAAEQEKIFERFYRRGSELRRETQGIGIGLSLVRHIMEAHGGRVTVQSEPGGGSRFTLEIPLNKTNE